MADADTGIIGCCGLCAFAALESWCILRADPFGAGMQCCGSPRGCCSSCCDSLFNKDDFDERVRRERARNGTDSDAESVASQPAPSDGMPTVVGDPKPTNVEA